MRMDETQSIKGIKNTAEPGDDPLNVYDCTDCGTVPDRRSYIFLLLDKEGLPTEALCIDCLTFRVNAFELSLYN